MAEFTIADLAQAINSLNSTAIESMVRLAQAAGGTLTVGSDTIIEIRDTNASGKLGDVTKDGNGVSHGDEVWILGTKVGETTWNKTDPNTHVITSVGVQIDAGALVELQFKIDQMMASVQESIKNSGKVSQTREGAARA